MRNEKFIRCTADFETTTQKDFDEERAVRVWAWQIRRIDNDEILATDTDIKKFFDFISKKNLELYFHNLKFDGTFIVDYMMRHGFKYKEQPKKPKDFSWLVDESGQWYNINIVWHAYNKRKVSTKIFDSYKILPFSVDKISKDFLGEEVKKLEIDYLAKRDKNHVLTQQEIDYLGNDTLIMSRALRLTFKRGLTQMTIASDAYNYFKDSFDIRKFKYMFPIIEKERDDLIRKSYKGGFVYVNEFAENKDFKNVSSFDVNSLYPSCMKQCLLPYGSELYYKGKYKESNSFPLYIQHIKCIFEVKDKHLPTIQIKHSFRFNDTEYLKSSNFESVDLWLTSIDLKLFLDHYNVFNVEYIEGFMFRGKTGIFDEYIDYWYSIKQNSKGAEKQFAKLMLNSLYGKFGSKTSRKKIAPNISKKDDKLQLMWTGEIEEILPKYTPMACFITAYARNKTIRSAQSIYDYFLYADTDSIKTTNSVEEISKLIEVDPLKLGAWKYEGTADRAKFLRAKTYITETNGKIDVKCAGMPAEVKANIRWEDFAVGAEFNGKKQAKKVTGGTLITETTFKIKNIAKVVDNKLKMC